MRFVGKLGLPIFVAAEDRNGLLMAELAKAVLTGIERSNRKFVVIGLVETAAYPEGRWAPLVVWSRRNLG